MEWEAWGWSAVPEDKDDKSTQRYVLGNMLRNLIVVTKHQNSCVNEIHGKTINEMLSKYIIFIKESDTNTLTRYAQKFGMTIPEFKNKFRAMYERLAEREPEKTI